MKKQPCAYCDKVFSKKHREQIFCSATCRNRARYKEPIERFWSYVQTQGDNNCWLWIGSRDTPQGYGRFRLNNRKVRAHRFAYQITIGEIPKGMDVLHRCDIKFCVNPNHLYLGTDNDNARDSAVRNRLRTKVSRDQVDQIRKLATSGVSHRKIASLFSISPSAVDDIVSYHSWKHHATVIA